MALIHLNIAHGEMCLEQKRNALALVPTNSCEGSLREALRTLPKALHFIRRMLHFSICLSILSTWMFMQKCGGKESICCTLSLLFLFGLNNYRQKINENFLQLQFCNIFKNGEDRLNTEVKQMQSDKLRSLIMSWIQFTQKEHSHADWKVAFCFAWIGWKIIWKFWTGTICGTLDKFYQ